MLEGAIQANEGEVTVLESMCPQCEGNGESRLLFTTIPHFRQVIVSSFGCHEEDCGHTNRCVQFSGEFPSHGVVCELHVMDAFDMNRQIVKSEHGVITIPELELEIPPATQSGTINTVEGILSECIRNLEEQQSAREPSLAASIEAFLVRARATRDLGLGPFRFVLDDPSGNSHIEMMPSGDKHLKVKKYIRTNAQREQVGLAGENTDCKVSGYNDARNDEEEGKVEAGLLDEILVMDEMCPSCQVMGKCKMHRCDIPFFKETIIMAFSCDNCGYRNSEVRGSGGISASGTRITLKVLNERDLCRDVLKSESCEMSIPELELELGHGTLGGMFTTVEGLLMQIHDHLASTAQSFVEGDSAAVGGEQNKWRTFLSSLNAYRKGESFPFTIIFDDPVGNIYVQNPRAHLLPPENVDPQLEVVTYTRTDEQNEELGLLDMKTENYE